MPKAQCYRCSDCGNSYAFFGKYATCPLCGEKCDPIQEDSGKILHDPQIAELVAEKNTILNQQASDLQTNPSSIHPKGVYDHRFGEFMILGFPPKESVDLAESRLDLAYVRKMIRGGCEVALAIRILL